MIEREFYESKIREAIELTGSKINKKVVDAIYEKIKYNFDEKDLLNAVEDIIETGNISYPSLLKSLRHHRSLNIEEKTKEEKKKRQEEIMQFWRENKRWLDEGTCDHKCFICPVTYCDLLAKKTIQAVKDILSKKKTPEEAHRELAKEFPMLGFENYLGEEPF